jgi:hypothetical protein
MPDVNVFVDGSVAFIAGGSYELKQPSGSWWCVSTCIDVALACFWTKSYAKKEIPVDKLLEFLEYPANHKEEKIRILMGGINQDQSTTAYSRLPSPSTPPPAASSSSSSSDTTGRDFPFDKETIKRSMNTKFRLFRGELLKKVVGSVANYNIIASLSEMLAETTVIELKKQYKKEAWENITTALRGGNLVLMRFQDKDRLRKDPEHVMIACGRQNDSEGEDIAIIVNNPSYGAGLIYFVKNPKTKICSFEYVNTYYEKDKKIAATYELSQYMTLYCNRCTS